MLHIVIDQVLQAFGYSVVLTIHEYDMDWHEQHSGADIIAALYKVTPFCRNNIPFLIQKMPH
jgi:hypothetical protein